MDAEAPHEAGLAPRVASAAELRALVADLVRREQAQSGESLGYRVIGIHASPTWTGDGVVANGEAVDVVACASVLALREALLEYEDSDRRLVVLTDRTEKELGLDVVARLARRRLHRLDPWETVKRLFRASRLDPRLAKAPALADALIAVAPPDGYPPVPAGMLDRETALRAVAQRAFDFPQDVDLRGLLHWAAGGGPVTALATAPAPLRA